MTNNTTDGASSVTRRTALRAAGAAGLAGAATVAGALPAQADPPHPFQLAAANTAAVSTRLDIITDPAGTPGVEIRTTTARDTLRVHSEHGNAIYAICNHTDTSRAAVSAYGTYLGVYAQINGTNAPAVMGRAWASGQGGCSAGAPAPTGSVCTASPPTVWAPSSRAAKRT